WRKLTVVLRLGGGNRLHWSRRGRRARTGRLHTPEVCVREAAHVNQPGRPSWLRARDRWHQRIFPHVWDSCRLVVSWDGHPPETALGGEHNLLTVRRPDRKVSGQLSGRE